MILSQALDGFLLSKRIEGLSPRSLEGYERQITHLVEFLNDPPLSSISTNDLRQFFDYLRTDYTPQRLSGDTSPLSAQTIKNYWIALRSFYTFAVDELGADDAMQPISPPKVTPAPVTPFTQDEVERMVKACTRTKDGRRHPNAHRNRAILVTLLDTGLRVTPLCSLKIGDYDQENGRLSIRRSKGGKRRVVYVGTIARKALWRMLAEREDRDDADAPLFASHNGNHLSRSWVRKTINSLGERAGVDNAYPHRCRHTFAIQWLRNSGDIFTLQRLLSHSTLEMVKRYLAIADVDAERAHRTASPVDNWKL